MVELTSSWVELDDSVEAINAEFHHRGWTDGHPIIPPTEERVKKFLEGVPRDPSEVVAVLEASKAEATVEKIAINAVMAGCRPEYMPIIVTAVRCIAEEPEPFYTWLTTAHSVSPLLIINGPVRAQLGISSGVGGTTVSWEVNAAIARAIRLLIYNIGGVPGATFMHSYGWLVQYSYCMAENEEGSPWDPYHVDCGFSADQSTVTVLSVEPPHHIEPRSSGSAQGLLGVFCDSMATTGCRNVMGDAFPVVLLCPDHARAIAAGGFSKEDVKRFLYEHARVPLYRFDPGHLTRFRPEWQKFYMHAPHALVPMVEKASDIYVFVVGGPGPNSLFMPGFAGPHYFTREIQM
ncbi:MAG: hypothetical protein HYX92_19375 [Chloroflexi bacterium]|nr:hypothetical protein [Chloroflexota bacterium]